MTAPEHIAYEFTHASGPSHVDCHALGVRYDTRIGLQRDASETYLLQIEGTRAHVLWRVPGFILGLWRSPSGHVFVADPTRGVLMNLDPARGTSPWRVDALPGVTLGVWGLDDDFVLAWGLAPRPGEFVMHRWDGARWSELPSPGHVLAVHGVERDRLYAVGNHGLIARWDGARWSRVPSPTRAVLSAVHVVSDDEMYAAGAGMTLLEGSTHGWATVLTTDEMLPCVAKRGEAVYVGAALSGLMRLDRDALVPVKPKLMPLGFDARPETGLLIACPNVIAHTVDGVEFNGTWVDTFAALAADDPTPWEVTAGYFDPPETDDDEP